MPTQKLVRLHRLGKGKSGEVRPNVHDVRVDLGCASNGGGTYRAGGVSRYTVRRRRGRQVKAPWFSVFHRMVNLCMLHACRSSDFDS